VLHERYKYYHNISNATAPVITVSASGANAGYTNIHLENIWASDCSYIDSTMTKHLYFVFSFLKSKKAEIFNMQKGAAQPHVYPKDIAELEIAIPNIGEIEKYNTLCSFLYSKIKSLKRMNLRLEEARNILIPRLMSGMIDIDEINYNYPKEILE